MTELTTSDFFPDREEKEIVAKALQTLTPREQTTQDITDNLVKLVFQGRKTFSHIATELGISRPTAYKYWNDWKHSEEAQQVDWEWWSLYRRLKRVNPAKALECLTRIKYRMTTEKIEADINTTNTENIHYTYTEEERKTLVNARRLLRDKVGSATRPDKLH